jgi:hypothetical protein
MKIGFPKVRSRIEKAFIAWHREHEKDWKRPLLFVSRTDGYLSLTIPGLSPAVSIYLHSYEFAVYAEWQDQYCDELMCYTSCPELTDKGYLDRYTLPDYRIAYPTREALWQAEMFEPLMTWINNKLVPAKWLGLYQICDPNGKLGGTWAELLAERDPKTFVQLPVWLNSSVT